jgi:hypothetical protein
MNNELNTKALNDLLEVQKKQIAELVIQQRNQMSSILKQQQIQIENVKRQHEIQMESLNRHHQIQIENLNKNANSSLMQEVSSASAYWLKPQEWGCRRILRHKLLSYESSGLIWLSGNVCQIKFGVKIIPPYGFANVQVSCWYQSQRLALIGPLIFSDCLKASIIDPATWSFNSFQATNAIAGVFIGLRPRLQKKYSNFKGPEQ